MLRTICVLSAWVVLGTALLFAQTTTGTLRGTVRDTSGVVLPGATVELICAAGTQTVVADGNGQYRFLVRRRAFMRSRPRSMDSRPS